MTDFSAVALIDPKFPHNVGNAWRAASVFSASHLIWTGDRVDAPERWPKGARLPREERMKLYFDVQAHHERVEVLASLAQVYDATPVCVEVSDSAERLFDFEHPERAVYVFGPEDGGVPKGVRTVCHRFVTIPAKSCLNLAAAVNVVLYDRAYKASYWSDLDAKLRA